MHCQRAYAHEKLFASVCKQQQPNEVEEVIKELKKNPGFSAYVIMNNDGIVIKYESMGYQQAVHHAALVLDLAAKSKTYMRELFEPPDVSALDCCV
jgi:dynein light chain roadblock-type